MTNINPIKLGISAQQLFTKENNEEIAKETAKEQQKEPAKELAAKDVLGYLAATNADIMPAKVNRTVDVSKYVNEEQTARIESFMKAFEADFDTLSTTALDEFPDLTQEAASSIALAYINQTY